MTNPIHALERSGNALRLGGWLIGAYALALGAIALYLSLDRPSRMVALPVAVIVATIAALIVIIRRRDPAPSYFEVGVMYAGIVGIYAAFPPAIAIVRHFEFSPLRDGRYVLVQPRPEQVATIAWWYAVYAIVFSATYLLVRPRSSERRTPILPAGRAIPVAAVILWVAAKLFEFYLTVGYGITSGSYGTEYLRLRELPTVVKQFANVFEGMDMTVQIILLAAMFCNYRRMKWMIVAFVGVLVAITILRRSARTEVAVVIMASMQLYDFLVRRISAKALAAAASIGFVLFLVMGVLRMDRGENRSLEAYAPTEYVSTDFEGIYTNALDLKFFERQSGAFRNRPGMLLADVAAILPQQLLPFRKSSLPIWYASTYFPDLWEAGGGRAFGVIPEAIVGYGIMELILCAMLAALLLGLVHRWYIRGRIGVISLAFYVWITIISYQMVRNTTLSVISQTLYRFVPALLATLLTAAALRRGRRLRERITI